MKLFIFIRPILISCLIPFSLSAQHSVNINFSQTTDSLKNLMGVNKFESDYVQGYIETGVSEVRLHDERASDYYNYSTFWHYDSLIDSFTHINSAFNPTDPLHYDWTELDATVNGVVNNGMEVYFRLGISWPDNNNYTYAPTRPPFDPGGTDFSKFAELCKRTVMHYNDGWDNGYYHGIRRWEVWNEPDYLNNFFWDGSPADFYKLYEAVSLSLKSHDSTLMVGASGLTPVTVVLDKQDFYLDFLNYVQNNNLPLDFLSWHLYGAKNPYGIKQWADQVRNNLDARGFTNTESHITELNYHLAQGQVLYGDNAAGATYLLSNLLSLQAAPVDKMYWYPGNALIETDSAGTARLKWNAYGMKTYQLMYQNAPIEVQTSGSLVVENNWEVDTTNLMILASKSVNNNQLYIAISNFNSNVTDFDIRCSNLPFNTTQQLKITQNVVMAPNDKFSQSINLVPGDTAINIQINNRPSPSITFLRIEIDQNASSGKIGFNKNDILIFPNPSDGTYYIDLGKKYDKISCTIHHSTGQVVYKQDYFNSNLIQLDLELAAGNFLLELKHKDGACILPIIKQ